MPTNVNDVTTAPIRMYEEERKVTGTNELGQDAFMQILVAQLANQDPLEPAKDTEFIAQMAQFTSLEQMQNMNEAIQRQTAYSYLGMEVSANIVYDATQGITVHREVLGAVEAITKMGSKEYLQVVDYISGETVLVPPDQVASVYGAVSGGNSVADMTIDDLKALIADTTQSIIGSVTGEDEEGEDEKSEGVEGADGSSEAKDSTDTGDVEETPEA